jgi:hypothetical protein
LLDADLELGGNAGRRSKSGTRTVRAPLMLPANRRRTVHERTRVAEIRTASRGAHRVLFLEGELRAWFTVHPAQPDQKAEGSVRSTTLRAFSEEEFQAILDKAP